MATDTTLNPLEMSDDEILGMASPPVVEEKTATSTEDTVDATNTDQSATTDEDGSGAGSTEVSTDTDTDTGTETGTETKTEAKTEVETPTTSATETKVEEDKTEKDLSDLSDAEILAKGKPDQKKPDETGATTATTTKVEEKTATKGKDTSKTTEDSGNKEEVTGKTDEKTATEVAVEPDYKAVYEEIMKPFKANGKTIELRDPKEAIKLMQMGANYTRRMQDLSEAKKIAMTLESNGITQDKLSFLIDLDKKNPEAIKKLLKDSGIDPMDIDTTTEPSYMPGNHQVTDEAVQFQTELDEIASTPEGRETLTAINSTWDDASKDALWKQPELMKVMHQHRAEGIYDIVAAEVDRLKTLGEISPKVPFLQAYKSVGDQLAANATRATSTDTGTGKQETEANTSTGSGQSQDGQVIATRAATPKPVVTDDKRVAAASVTRTSPTHVDPPKQNPLAMADEDFLKQMNGRL